jgi:hypothetical protein
MSKYNYYAGYLEDSSIMKYYTGKTVFLKNITYKMVGTQVVLMDGRLGEIVYLNPHDDMKPMIQVNSVFIDLSKERNLHIKEIIS